MLTTGGGRFYWVRNEGSAVQFHGIVVIFTWGSVQDNHLNNFLHLYSSLGWDSLVCLSDFLNPFFPERATSLAFSVLNELLEELRGRPCPLVLVSLSGGSKACMYKVFQIIQGTGEAQLNLDDSRLIMACISGQIYDSGPVDFSGDLGARFALHPAILSLPGSAKLFSLVAKGVSSGLDALFVTRFGSQRSEYWETLYSSVDLGAPFLILCSQNDDLAPFLAICSFAQRLQELGGNVRLVKWKDSPHVGHYQNNPVQYGAAVTELLERACLVFTQKVKELGERTCMDGMNDKICELICELQNAAVDSNQSLRRVAIGPNDHFFLPSSAEYQGGRESGPLQDEQKERTTIHLPSPPRLSAHTVLGQILFDACVPKNIEGWDIKFSGSLNGQPIGSARKLSPLNALKRLRRSRL